MTSRAATLPMTREAVHPHLESAARTGVGRLDRTKADGEMVGDVFHQSACEVDARAGGKFLIHVKAPDGTVYPMSGTFTEVDKPARLVSWRSPRAYGTKYLESRLPR